MQSSIYSALSRQAGLKTEFDIIANNLANASTTGFRKDSITFSEFIRTTGSGQPSISMTDVGGRHIDTSEGVLKKTNGTLDLAIQGPGFFQTDDQGELRLTRNGAFSRNELGLLSTTDGFLVLDSGNAPIFIPPDANEIAIAADGSLSADGVPLAEIGIVQPLNTTSLERIGANAFRSDGLLEPAQGATLLQGFIEGSNVNPMEEIARMIEVQRRYESTKSFIDREHNRIKDAISTMGK